MRTLTLDPVDKQGPRLCDLSAEELKKLWQKPNPEEMKNTMETIARLAFQLRGIDVDKQRQLVRALKVMQELSNKSVE